MTELEGPATEPPPRDSLAPATAKEIKALLQDIVGNKLLEIIQGLSDIRRELRDHSLDIRTLRRELAALTDRVDELESQWTQQPQR